MAKALLAEKRAWETRAQLLAPACKCWECLRERGITPHRNAPAAYRSDITGTLYRCDNGHAERSTVRIAGSRSSR